MRVTVTLEHRFRSTPDGKVYAQTMFPYKFWLRYLEVFSQVNIVARTLAVETIPDGWHLVNGDNVFFSPVPYYLGPFQYLLRSGAIKRAVRDGVAANDAVIMRIGSQIAACLEPVLYTQARPYGVEVVGDPYDVFAPGAMKHPLRFFFRWWSPRKLRRQCSHASAAAYVTKRALQRRYPPSDKAYTTNYSDVELPPGAFASKPRDYHHLSRVRLVNVGTMNQLYKAQDVLLKAIKICLNEIPEFKLVLIGDGKHRSELQEQARILGIRRHVEFLGQLTAGTEVRKELDKADVFVLPSRQEGLPRALIEAMARGLPCIASTVGGIPELLTQDDLVPPDDSFSLARKVCEVVSDPKRMRAMAARNWKKAQNYHDHFLNRRRRKFYQAVRVQTEQWAADKIVK